MPLPTGPVRHSALPSPLSLFECEWLQLIVWTSSVCAPAGVAPAASPKPSMACRSEFLMISLCSLRRKGWA
ncbi:hypothetical protein H074_33109 [Amycolatopsis decaplanina DSM 44594]|uniref:Uncharacterized protein n=1 Tax=Amycolatopsis decaplanina DSM 44594 TaxID=1284240 RepID=M2YC55_9PSEU|nr:hypothetical protein H074_33109 [Amycolatopsis decaplanina DSM 44594]